MKVWYCLILAICLALTGASGEAFAAKSKPNNKYASLVMDADTGMILSQQYANKRLHPASLTKMMTLLMLFEAIERNEITLRDRIRISPRATQVIPSKLGLKAGSTIKVEDAIYALVTKSANDIAVAIAEDLAGTETRFAGLMTRRARDIGMNDTTFRNASGLHDSRQVTTAADMARLARYILIRYPGYYRYFGTRQFTYQGKTYNNHNRLMSSYEGMDGFKTGYINASGFNLVASAKRDGHRLIGVVFGGRTSKSRNDHMAQLLDTGFKKVGNMRIAKAVNPPPPTRKPTQQQEGGEAAYASLAALKSDRHSAPNTTPPSIDEALQKGEFSALLGEGDYDPAISKRLETGLLAVAVHTGKYDPDPGPSTPAQQGLKDVGYAVVSKMASYEPAALNAAAPKDTAGSEQWTPVYSGDNWAIQIGAYGSRIATDEALREALKKLPDNFAGARPLAVPLYTRDGTVFRARLSGLSKSEAITACGYFKDCLTVAPRTE